MIFVYLGFIMPYCFNTGNRSIDIYISLEYKVSCSLVIAFSKIKGKLGKFQ